MKCIKKLLIAFILVGATACSGTSVKDETVKLPPSSAVYTAVAGGGSVVITEESKEIEFRSLGGDRVALSMKLNEAKDIKRVLLYDGSEVIRVGAQGGRVILSGEDLNRFRSMIDSGKEITIKGRLGQQEYVSYRLNLGDTHVISQIFGKKEIYVKN